MKGGPLHNYIVQIKLKNNNIPRIQVAIAILLFWIFSIEEDGTAEIGSIGLVIKTAEIKEIANNASLIGFREFLPKFGGDEHQISGVPGDKTDKIGIF